MAGFWKRKFLQIEFGRFFQVGNRFFYGFSLTNRPYFRAIRHIPIIFLVD